MPSPIKCPACGMDGTAAANESIAYMLSLQPKAAVAPAPVPVPIAAPPPVPVAAAIAAAPPIPAAAPSPPRSFAPAALAATPIAPAAPPASYAPLPTTTTSTSSAKGWKWWYYICAGILIGAIDGIAIYQTGNLSYIKGLLLSILLIAIGVWDFSARRKKK